MPESRSMQALYNTERCNVHATLFLTPLQENENAHHIVRALGLQDDR